MGMQVSLQARIRKLLEGVDAEVPGGDPRDLALIVAGAATGQSEIIGNLGQVREVAPTDQALTIKKLNGYGGGQNDTVARTIIGGTALPATTGIAANWFPLGPAIGKPGAVAVGGAIWYAIDGRIIVPPGRYFALHTFSDIVTDTFQVFVGWHELQLNLG
jgi:hypothetical protein